MTETYSTTSHSGPEPSKSIAEHLAQVLVLTGIPCGCMVFGAILVQFWQPGPKFRSACQHFSSGILLAAISCELMPEIIDRVNETKHQGYQYPHFFFLFGFVAGFMFLLGLGRFMGYITGQAGGHSHGHHAEPEPIEPIDVQPSFDALNNPVGSPRTTRRFDSSATLGEKSSLVAHEGQPPDVALVKGKFDDIPVSSRIPWSLLIVVTLDCSMDGLLIGIAEAADENGGSLGWMLAISLAVESAFLGVTTSASLVKRGVPRLLGLVLCAVIPLFLIVGGCSAVVLADSMHPLAFISALSFGIAGLVYLITEELLVEAHEDKSTDTWYVSIQFFIGFATVAAYDMGPGSTS